MTIFKPAAEDEQEFPFIWLAKAKSLRPLVKTR